MFFDDKKLLSYTGVTGKYFIHDRVRTELNNQRETAESEFMTAQIAHDVADAALDGNRFTVDDALYTAFNKTSEAVNHARSTLRDANAALDAHESIKPFQPFDSVSGALFSASSIVVAPVVLLLLAVDKLCSYLVAMGKYLSSLATPTTQEAQQEALPESSVLLKEANAMMGEACKLSLMAIASPFVNAVDFVGSLVTSALPNDSSTHTAQP
ncbi:MAG: hypothetical protein P1U36_04855 [Legionellaceae bacterium]|nr:hypothetical protein [Legionellaceae bacterium]